ncbi:hypothetical protein WJX75_006244 [Coccomyxa subellipsoidea]|uniref:Sec39 domain-containing protein n=1 Tax=Coccomyxa subellipsoidea TaxID=248742 RepID=A0ABR2YYG3_9CHLO
MVPDKKPMYFQKSVVYSGGSDDVDRTSISALRGDLALSPNNASLAVISRHGKACHILHLSAAACVEQHSICELGEHASTQQTCPLCTWSSNGRTLAVTIENGQILLGDRDGREQSVVKHSHWQHSRIVSLFSTSNDVLLVLCEDGSLWAVSLLDSSILAMLSDKGQTGFPSCSAYDAATGILFIASRGSRSEGAPFDSSKGSQGLQKRPYPGCATPKWAQSPRQAVMWSSSHMAVLGSDGILSVVDIRTLDACLQISGCSRDAVLAAAGPGAGAGPAPANIYMLSEHCDESGAGTPDGSRGWQVEALIERSAEEQLEELISAQDWPAAIKVAQEHSLSADPVHKARFSSREHIERLHTFLDLHGGAFDPRGYGEFQECTLKEAAMAFAASGSAAAVKKMLQRHTYTLMPHVLEILSCFPETLPPKSYADILPKAAREDGLEPPQLLREADWVESAEMCRDLQESGEYGMLISTEHMARTFIGWRPPTAHQVGQWFTQRALEVDTRSGQLTWSGALLRLCSRADALQGVKDMQEAVSSLREIAQPGEEGGDGWAIGLDAWASLDMAQRLRLLAAGDLPMEHQRAQLAKLLERVQPTQRQQLLVNLLEHLAPLRLQWCADFLRQEAQQPQVFRGGGGIAQAAVLGAYACQDSEDEGAPEVLQHKEELDQVLSLVGAAKLLRDLGCPMTLAQLRDCDAAGQIRITQTLLARLSRSQPPLTDQRWTELWRQLRDLRQGAFSQLPPEDLLADFCAALLRCAKWRLAQKYLAGTASVALDPGRAEDLVLACAKEYFFSADSLHSPEVAQAQACLDVLPSSVAAAAERSFIKGVLRLQDFGVQIPPLQCCQVGDRMELLQMALDARPGAHADGGRLALLAELLGVAERHSELLLRRARAALDAGDLAAAREHAANLAAQGYVPAWDVAAQVIKLREHQGRQDDSEDMQTLLAFCLAHCPDDQVQVHLDRWKDLRQPEAPLSSMEDVRALLQRTVRSTGHVTNGILPDVGDAVLALSCMLALGPSADPNDTELLQGLSFAASRSVLLLRMFASSLQALSPESFPLDDIGGALTTAQELLHIDPWDACGRSAALDPGRLSGRARAARQRGLEARSRLTAAADERALRSLLPASAVPLFTAGASSEAADLRQAALLQVVTTAAAEGPGAAARQHLQQALMLAERYRLSAWLLQMRYTETLLLGTHPPTDINEAVEAVKDDLLKEPREAIRALATHVWPHAGAATHWQLSLLLSLLEDCLTALGGSQGKQQLPAAKEFVQRCSRIAPEMNAKLLLAPMLAAAVAGIDTSFSPQIITTVLNATSTGELTECNGEAAPKMAPQERPRGAEKPPLKRMLFAADDTADSGQQLIVQDGITLLDAVVASAEKDKTPEARHPPQAEMQEVRTLLEELRRVAGALSLLAHLRDQAGLTDAQLQVGLRQEVWQALLGFVLDAEQADSAALPPVLALVGAIAPNAAGSSRWHGWQPEGDSSAQLGQMLLLSRTQACLAADLPGMSIRAGDVAGLQAAEALFTRLLGCAHSQQQLLTLMKLLRHVWDSGFVFNPKNQVGRGLQHGDVSMRGASENGNVHHATAGSNHRQQSHSAEAASQGLGQAEAVPLHGCWAALLKHMLQDGSSVLVASVLRTVEDAAARQPFLITPAEAHTLTEAASCAGNDVAVTLGLLLPYPEVQAAAGARLHSSQHLSEAPGDSLIAVLLSRRLWPSMAHTPAYPRLSGALLKRTPHLTGEGAGAGGETGPAAAAALAPSAAASLAESGQHAAAAAIAASHLGVHPALSTLGGGLSMLGPYLRGAARAVEAAAPAQGPVNDAEDVSVPHAIEQVWGMLSGQCDRALSRLRQDAP